MRDAGSDVAKITKVLKDRFSRVKAKRVYGRTPALNVLECVLSLNRPFDGFVVPRLDAFASHHPRLQSLQNLRQLILRYRSPLAFSITELHYRDRSRAKTLLGVTEYLLAVQKKLTGQTEGERLRRWAAAVQPADFSTLGVRGLGVGRFPVFTYVVRRPDRQTGRTHQEVNGQRRTPRCRCAR